MYKCLIDIAGIPVNTCLIDIAGIRGNRNCHFHVSVIVY